MGDSVKVAVRVRPFNQRELKANSPCAISMRGETTTITHPGDRSEKTFSFDHSYWSHDGYTVGQDGVSVPDSKHSKYADQRTVFRDLGRGVLDNAWQGYNAALFAYGQTGSGKSYSMVGYGANRGIVPITCSELFTAVGNNQDNRKQFQVTFSMLEIYNEQVRDLLVSTRRQKQRSHGGMRVRLRPGHGFYCEGLKQVPVQTYAEMERLMEEGVVNRTTASTSMNATSSRSHMVITIGFKQVFPNEEGLSTTKTSEISLVDLAGSERAASTEATGDRLKEGSAINTSLLTLGNVIHALAESSSNKKKKVNIPYRNSVLTKLLMSALGGNSKTIMIAALSPAAMNYEETLSTLRYADRAKQIKNKAVVNESLTDKLIRELRTENQRLLEQLKKMGLGSSSEKALDVQQLLQDNQRQMAEIESSWEQRLEEARKEWEKSQEVTSEEMPAVWRRTPYITNVNEDPQLSGVIRFGLNRGESLLGKPGALSVDIEMKGLGILNHHAIISNTGKEVYMSPGSKQASIMVNGKAVTSKTRLNHLDRVKLGSNSLYLYVGFPQERAPEERPLETYTYDVLQAELAEGAGRAGPAGGGGAGEAADDPEIRAIFEEYISLLPRVTEVNAMSADLGKDLEFELEVKNLATHDARGRAKDRQIIVRLTNKANKVWVWSKEKFMNRKYIMEDLYNRWLDGEELAIDRDADPFWDPVEDVFVGSVHVWLAGLAYCMESDDQLEVRDYRGKGVGYLHVKLTPCDVTGQPLQEEMLILDPAELLGSRLDFLTVIPEGSSLRWNATDPSRGTFCRFSFYNQPEAVVTRRVSGSSNPRYIFTKQLTVTHVNPDFLSYLQTHALVIEVWGTQVESDQSDVTMTKHAADEEPEAAIVFLQEKLKKQEQELATMRRDMMALHQENALLQRGTLSAPGTQTPDPRRRKSAIDDGTGQPVPSRRSSIDPHGRSSTGGARRKVGVFLPMMAPGHPAGYPRPGSRLEVTYTPPESPRGSSVHHQEYHPGGSPVRPSITAIIPGPRIQRRGSVATPTTPSSSTSGGTPPTGTRRNQQQQQAATPRGGEVKDTSLDVELVKALKVFFKDMKNVQREMKSLRKLGEEVRAAGDNGHLKAAAGRQQEALTAVETDVNSHLAGLKDVVRAIIRKRRQDDT